LTLSRIVASSLIAAAVPLFADNGRQHVVVATPTVTIRGVVRDSGGAPVAGAYVRSGTYSSSRNNGTKADGKYSLTIPGGRPTLLTVEDFAFEPVTVSMTPKADMTVDFTLTTSRPTVTVKLTNGEKHVLDLGTSRFAYYIVFAGYARFNSANLCKTDGSAFAPHKTEFAKIVGPFSLVNFSPCCSRGAVVTANVEMKSGDKMQVYFNESCYGSELDFLGRERSTGLYNYFKFDDIAEIEFQ
jgi:carboxypeptidase family protein